MNDDKDVDENKDNEPKHKLFGKLKVEPTVHNNEEKERKDDKGEEDDGSKVLPLENHYKQQHSDSDSDSVSDSDSNDENKKRNRIVSKEAPTADPMKSTLGFLSGKNGIFGDSNEKDKDQTPKKIRKTGRSLFSRINGISTNNTD